MNSIPDNLCPLCRQQNHCGNVENKNSITNPADRPCWCNSEHISFPKALTDKVPTALKGKACICQKCAREFQL